jgi:hypothetical protein
LDKKSALRDACTQTAYVERPSVVENDAPWIVTPSTVVAFVSPFATTVSASEEVTVTPFAAARALKSGAYWP